MFFLSLCLLFNCNLRTRPSSFLHFMIAHLPICATNTLSRLIWLNFCNHKRCSPPILRHINDQQVKIIYNRVCLFACQYIHVIRSACIYQLLDNYIEFFLSIWTTFRPLISTNDYEISINLNRINMLVCSSWSFQSLKTYENSQ